MRLDFAPLSTRPDAIPLVARWWCDEWGLPERHQSIESYLTELRNLDLERLPMHLVAMNDDQVVGVATLKDQNALQAQFPRFQYWLSGVYVPPSFRRKGVATALCLQVVEEASEMGVSHLYLQTEALDGGLYGKIGWKPVERVQSGGIRDILIMVRDVVPTTVET